MNKFFVPFIVLFLVAQLLVVSMAQTNGVEATENSSFINVEAEVPILSSFTSRGRVFQDNTVVEPNVTILKEFSEAYLFANAWGNVNSKERYGDTVNEVDLTIGGSTKFIPGSSMNYGYIEYIYNGQEIENTREVYFGLILNEGIWRGINPYATIYMDIGEINGQYISSGISHTWDMGLVQLVGDTSLGFGTFEYNKGYFGIEEDKLNDWSTGLTMKANTTRNTTIALGVRYSDLVDSDMEKAAKEIYGNGDIFITKASVTCRF